MTDEAKRRKIKQLRALADSTTFPAEAASARAKADKLEGELPKRSPFAGPEQVPPPFSHLSDAFAYQNAARTAQQQAQYTSYSGNNIEEALRHYYDAMRRSGQ